MNARYMIIFNYMQQFYCLICQSNSSQNARKVLYQKGEIFVRYSQNLISMRDDELVDDRNQVYVKIYPR